MGYSQIICSHNIQWHVRMDSICWICAMYVVIYSTGPWKQCKPKYHNYLHHSCIPVFCAAFEGVSWGVCDECTVNGYHISNSVIYAGCVITAHMTRCALLITLMTLHSKEVTILMAGLFLKWPYKFCIWFIVKYHYIKKFWEIRT
jgi:hypothetical protein